VRSMRGKRASRSFSSGSAVAQFVPVFGWFGAMVAQSVPVMAVASAGKAQTGVVPKEDARDARAQAMPSTKKLRVTRDLAGLEAGCADVEALGSPRNHGADALDVRVPASRRAAVRVRD
jgi:hypothetical protein